MEKITQEKPKNKDRLRAEFNRLSYVCYCQGDIMCKYCRRQIEIKKELEEFSD